MGTNEAPPLICSISNNQHSEVRFINTTKYQVEILWINYKGQAVSYGTLGPGRWQDITTFVTHPWIFLEKQLMERFVVNGKDVFYPKPGIRIDGRPNRCVLHLVYITIPMYSLREIAMRTIKLLLLNDSDAYRLDIPKNLQRELATMEPRKISHTDHVC